MSPIPIAVHISDGVLYWPWLLLGFAVSGGLLFWSAWRVDDDEIPRIGLLTAAFFVASLIHVRVGPTSVHLLLNGLVGMILGPAAVLAVGVGLFLQAVLLNHGGYTSLGVNCAVIALPALLAPQLFRKLSCRSNEPAFRYRDGGMAVAYLLHPLAMAAFAFASLFGARFIGRSGEDKDFRAGFAVGVSCVLLTTFMNAVLLIVAGIEDWRAVAVLVIVAHLPIAFIEGLIVGCAASFLRRVKPEMLERSSRSRPTPAPADQ